MTPEIDNDFFPGAASEDLIVVSERNLSFIEDRLRDLINRAKYYDDYPKTKSDFTETCEELSFLCRALRESGK